MQNIKLVFLSIILSALALTGLFGQETGNRPSERELIAPDTLINPEVLRDTLLPVLPDSILIVTQEDLEKSSEQVGDIETVINYFAEDSIVSDFTANKVFLYNDAWFEYGNIRLDADYIVIDWEKSELYASGLKDSLGVVQGTPVFKEGASVYEIRKEMRYNFKSQKAIISDVVTQQDEGLLRGEKVKKGQDGSIYLHKGFYTTCDLVEPHWHISSAKIKSIRGKQVISGPFNLYFNNIPTPLGLPFGIIPDTPEEKESGIIFPSYGEEQIRGFFLREFGYYFAFNDYIHTKITGELYSKGGYGLKTGSVYNKRYRFKGGFNVDYQRFQSPETAEVPLEYDAFWFRWNHTPESRGNSRFSASANFGTKSYNDNILNQANFQQNMQSDFSSNIAYSKTFVGTPFSMSANLRHSQNQVTDEVNLLLPDIAINMNRQNPFRNIGFEPLKTLNIAWNFNAQNSINNRITPEFGVDPNLQQTQIEELGRPGAPDILPFTFANLPQLLREAENGFRHTVPVSSNFTLFRFFTGTAAMNFTELWYLDRINYYYNPDEQRVDRILESGFNRINYYNASFNLSTNIYGFYTFKKGSKIEAIRHHMQPTFGFTSTPDFSNPRFGFYQEVQTHADGRTQRMSRYQGFIYGGAPMGEAKSLSINIRNVVEAKIRTESDTAEVQTKKIPLLQTLNVSTNYNFAVDSFNLAPLNLNTRTSLLENKISVFLSANLDPYATATFQQGEREVTRRINEFAFRRGQGIGAIRSATLNLNGSLNPGRSERSPGEVRDELTNDFLNQGGQMNEFVQNEIDRIANDPSQYIDWSIPWNMTFGYNLSYNKAASGNTNITQAINVSGDISLSDKWKINFNSGYDVAAARITQTMVGIARDLHCWQMNVNWVPFGRFTSYNVDIRVKSNILRDLKVSRRRSFFDSF
ncbi:putative LPS assembly protein LptD [Negadavirga shengliensis]|uniref:LPS assembly protein LptD n=1 Tax=Negadavirga shengliensis TaxID=1389218 RepID=A0ABV9T6G3_9BACT